MDLFDGRWEISNVQESFRGRSVGECMGPARLTLVASTNLATTCAQTRAVTRLKLKFAGLDAWMRGLMISYGLYVALHFFFFSLFNSCCHLRDTPLFRGCCRFAKRRNGLMKHVELDLDLM